MLNESDAIRKYLKEERRLQKGKYKLRQTVFVFKCKICPIEIEVRKPDLKKVSGLCRQCADISAAIKRHDKARKHPYVVLWNKFTYDRKRFGQSNDLTFPQFLEFTNIKSCHYCDTQIEWAPFRDMPKGHRYNLDRKDNSKGYSIENCVVCCWECNELKGARLTYGEMLVVSEALKKHRGL